MAYDDEKVKRSAYTKTESNTKRNYISSGNFKKSTSFQVFHNANIRPDYAIGGEIICNLNGYEALELKNKIIAEAKEAYEKNKKPKAPSFKAKSYEWSLVVNLKPESTMQDLEKLAQHFSDKYGFQCYQIAIHRDEGHINEQGEKVINHHAHMEFITLDRQTGKNNYNREKISPKVLREMQTEVAEILQMERGQDKRLSGRQRIEPRKYAQMKEAEKGERKELKQELSRVKQDLDFMDEHLEKQKAKFREKLQEKDTIINQLENQTLSPKEIKAVLEDFRKQSIGKGYPKEFFRELSDLKQNTKETTTKDLKNMLEDLAANYENEKSKRLALEQELQTLKEREKELKESLEKLKSEKNALESDLKQKEQKNDETQAKENKNDLRGNSVRLNDINEKELKELNEKINRLKQKPTLKALERIDLEKYLQEKNKLLGIDNPQKEKDLIAKKPQKQVKKLSNYQGR
ncbi:mobilization protein [Campylobacter upsaliensis]|nr:mobilization protein [Campylobacter upsaliensis]